MVCSTGDFHAYHVSRYRTKIQVSAELVEEVGTQRRQSWESKTYNRGDSNRSLAVYYVGSEERRCILVGTKLLCFHSEAKE